MYISENMTTCQGSSSILLNLVFTERLDKILMSQSSVLHVLEQHAWEGRRWPGLELYLDADIYLLRQLVDGFARFQMMEDLPICNRTRSRIAE